MTRRLHIVGCPRSGTTLMMELMATCFAKSAYCEHEMSLFDEPDGAPELFFSKQPSDIRFLDLVFRQDPGLFVICMIRDPRAVITSIHGSRPGDYFCNYRVWRECALPASAFIDHPRFMLIRYEDLVNDPDRIQTALEARFVFLEKICKFSEYEERARPSADALRAMSGLRAVERSRVSGWHAHLPRIKAELSKHPEMLADLVTYGYEVDEHWVDLLAEVTAEEFPCRYPDRAPWFKSLETRLRKWRASRRYLARRRQS